MYSSEQVELVLQPAGLVRVTGSMCRTCMCPVCYLDCLLSSTCHLFMMTLPSVGDHTAGTGQCLYTHTAQHW